ncbi:Nitroreductase family protein [Vibrio crassostreae]|nr:nitroreductase family protein [Vibrio crassostreae]CAK2026590.1 Nitroreductase family protein [Vibrio crassostreae]CAK2065277.1 Nitroreductase family protein [Vibrio crassostreae]CAK2070534.1 Nitroreductase family protein [Vibrio crassostreae]CAK2850509.1 Nitroreductase family protein [Vibrio crassostreae]
MEITPNEREAVYKTIFSRRDVRGQFLSDEIPEDVLMRVLTAAHHAPSVGFMQPWDFVVVRDIETK